MWGSSWTLWGGVVAAVAVVIAALFTAWTPIFGILIVVALIPVAAFFLVARRSEEEAGPAPESQWADAPRDVGPEHDLRVEDGMVSDRQRARPN
jgi:hypothetical protein